MLALARQRGKIPLYNPEQSAHTHLHRYPPSPPGGFAVLRGCRLTLSTAVLRKIPQTDAKKEW